MKNSSSLYKYRDTFYQYREDITKDIFKIYTLRICLPKQNIYIENLFETKITLTAAPYSALGGALAAAETFSTALIDS